MRAKFLRLELGVLSVFKWFETDGLISQRRDWLIGFPGCPAVNQLSFVQPVNRFRQRVVVAVAPAAYRRLDPRFAQSINLYISSKPVERSVD